MVVMAEQYTWNGALALQIELQVKELASQVSGSEISRVLVDYKIQNDDLLLSALSGFTDGKKASLLSALRALWGTVSPDQEWWLILESWMAWEADAIVAKQEEKKEAESKLPADKVKWYVDKLMAEKKVYSHDGTITISLLGKRIDIRIMDVIAINLNSNKDPLGILIHNLCLYLGAECSEELALAVLVSILFHYRPNSSHKKFLLEKDVYIGGDIFRNSILDCSASMPVIIKDTEIPLKMLKLSIIA